MPATSSLAHRCVALDVFVGERHRGVPERSKFRAFPMPEYNRAFAARGVGNSPLQPPWNQFNGESKLPDDDRCPRALRDCVFLLFDAGRDLDRPSKSSRFQPDARNIWGGRSRPHLSLREGLEKPPFPLALHRGGSVLAATAPIRKTRCLRGERGSDVKNQTCGIDDLRGKATPATISPGDHYRNHELSPLPGE